MKKCKLCERIYSYEEAEKWADDYGWWYNNIDIDYNIIVKHNNDFELWDRCDDNYYTGYVMTMRYCPKCGRKLAGAGTRS